MWKVGLLCPVGNQSLLRFSYLYNKTQHQGKENMWEATWLDVINQNSQKLGPNLALCHCRYTEGYGHNLTFLTIKVRSSSSFTSPCTGNKRDISKFCQSSLIFFSGMP
jgi:hypothetical protein